MQVARPDESATQARTNESATQARTNENGTYQNTKIQTIPSAGSCGVRQSEKESEVRIKIIQEGKTHTSISYRQVARNGAVDLDEIDGAK